MASRKLLLPNLDLLPELPAVFTLNRCNLNQPVWNFLVNSNKVICRMSPAHPPTPPHKQRRGDLHNKTFAVPFPEIQRCPCLKTSLFSSLRAPLCHPSSYKNPSILYNPLKGPSGCWMGCCLIHESITPIRSQIYSAEFCFFMNNVIHL